MKRKNSLKYLSQSVLLEEAGLPYMNTLIIVIVALALAAFLGWATIMPLDEVVSVKGTVTYTGLSNKTYSLVAQIPSDKINDVKSGNSVVISIPSAVRKDTIPGTLTRVSKAPVVDLQGRVYYEASIVPLTEAISNEKFQQRLLPGMETQIDVIVGSKTLMEYLLGPIFSVKRHAFTEQ